ncbi:MAG: TonB-dependent receptor domain-containing protein [Cyanophyceae cyanobacterium]
MTNQSVQHGKWCLFLGDRQPLLSTQNLHPKILLWAGLSTITLGHLAFNSAAAASLNPTLIGSTEESAGGDRPTYSESIPPEEAASPSAAFLTQTEPAQLETAQADTTVDIVNVQLETTDTGLNVVLETATGALSPPAPTTDGNSLVSDIPNARLALPGAQNFEAIEPGTGISSVRVTQLEGNLVRIRVTGSEGAPVGDIQSRDNGFALSVSPLPVAADVEEDEGILRITVTAEKTPEDPRDVPVSLTVLTEDELEDSQINSISQVAANTPNFYFTPGDRVFTLYSIRGLGNSSNILVRDSVSFYIDDVPYDNVHQFFPTELFDLEQVEILRGPQSTLYGRNSQAGVVNITSRPPSEDPELRGSVLVGNVGQRQAQLSMSTSIVPDTLGVRLSATYRELDGFTENTFLDNNAEDQSAIAGRINFLWTPSDRWSIDLNATIARTRDDASVYVGVDQDDPFEVSRSDNGKFDLDTTTQSLRVSYAGDKVRFTSITSYSDTDYAYNSVSDDFGSVTISDYDQSIFNQELRLQSSDPADPLQWIVGAFFQDRYLRIGDSLDLPPTGTDIGEATYDQTTYAGFAQVDYSPIEALTLTAGLRYEYWQEDLNRDAQVFRNPDGSEIPSEFRPAAAIDGSDIDGDVWLPRFAATYRLSPNVAVYGSVARGYRPGTHNYLALSDQELIVEPENSWNYELGVKTSWFDDRLGINLSAFYNDINKFQVLVLDNSFTFADISNAEARALGVELELRATPFAGFDIIAGFGYTDAEFTDNTNPATGENFDGNQLIYAPDYTYNIAMQYRSPNGLFGRLELQGIGTVFFDEANESKEDPYTLVNARIGYEFDKVGVYLFANNLFNTEYVVLAFPGFSGDTIAAYGDRRTFGIQVRAQF